MEFSIGEIARATGTSVQTIRYYEKRGLLCEPIRNEGGHRRYASADLQRLAFVRHARSLGFSLPQIADLLELADHPQLPCTNADQIATANLNRVRERIAALQDLEKELVKMLDGPHGKSGGTCRVIETLADHQLCLHGQHKDVAASNVG
ncbi:MAG: MerR family transcriptional regulator [Robiginitomaculum sp.]|nr:MAG: MerR family transcriptional regulator [Robiginitomaculum sp.]